MFDFQEFCTHDLQLTSERRNKLARLNSGNRVCYLDNAGASLYSETQVQTHCWLLCEQVYGNPHSGNQSSSLSTDAVEQVRQRIARFFNTSLDEYSVIFTSGCTGSLKLLGESFSFHGNVCSQCKHHREHPKVDKTSEILESSQQQCLDSQSDKLNGDGAYYWKDDTKTYGGGLFCYTEDNHTSVVGMREIVKHRGHRYCCIPQEEVGRVFGEGKVVQTQSQPQSVDDPHNADITAETEGDCDTHSGICRGCGNNLFVYPAQSNFNGRKYPSCWIGIVQRHGRRLTGAISQHATTFDIPGKYQGQRKWFVGLDAASFVSTSPLDLNDIKPDFVTLSFYKIFGFPTGLGALLVRNTSAHVLQKSYFGGGTVDVSISREDFYIPRKSLNERFEDGTISFLDIIALNAGFDSLQQIAGSMRDISLHTFQLGRFVYRELQAMTHRINGAPVVRLYQHGHFDDITKQGPIICFNVLRADGSCVGFSQVDKLAQAADIHLRTGCFCNMGACQHYLQMTSERVKRNHQAGHVCGDEFDLIEGEPTGACRISFGYFSTLEDTFVFLDFMSTCFMEGSSRVDYLKQGKEILRKHYQCPGNLTGGVQNGAESGRSQEDMIDSLVCEGEKYVQGGNSVTKESCDMENELMNMKPDVVNSAGNKTKPESVEVGTRNESIGEEVIANGYKGDKVLTNIVLYPVKSCGGFEVSAWELGPRGLVYDREWMVTTDTGVCLSQKREPKLCVIKPVIDLNRRKLGLKAEGHDDLELSLDLRSEDTVQGQLCQSKVCGDRIQGCDCGEEVSRWLEQVLGKSGLRLVRQSETDVRSSRMSEQEAGMPSLSLANEAQFLLINRTSCCVAMETMKTAESTEETLSRFRANLIVSTDTGFEEDHWKEISIGSQKFMKQRQCTRCQMITVHQTTGERSKEPLLQLAKHKHRKMTFGILLYHKDTSPDPTDRRLLRVGDKVEVIADDINSGKT